MMEEMNPYPTRINNPNHMVVMRNATFSWDMDKKDIEITKDGTLDIEIKGKNIGYESLVTKSLN